MDLDGLQGALGYPFQDRDLLRRAVTHRSGGAAHNERLEFLGDAVLGYVVARRLFEGFPEARERDLTLMRASLVRKDALADVAREIGLGGHIVLGIGERRSGVRDRASVLADALESVLGAVAIDGGVAAAGEVVERLFRARMEALDGAVEQDAKTRLQECLQARRLALPDYVVESVDADAQPNLYVVCCRVEALGLKASAGGESRKSAEQLAARAVLERIP